MDIKNTISSTEARKKIAEILGDIEKTGARYTLTVNGRARAVVMSPEEFEGWMETLEIMSNPKLVSQLRKAEAQIARGEYITLEELEEKLAKREQTSTKK